MAYGLMHCVGGQLGLFNGSNDITFSLDYRRLDDGSTPGYSNNRWAHRKDAGLYVRNIVTISAVQIPPNPTYET